MTVLGIDPGVNNLGYGVINWQSGQANVLGYGRISPRKDLLFSQKIEYLYQKIDGILSEFHPDAIITEEIYLGKNVKVAFKIGQIIGIARSMALRDGLRFALISAREVKKNIVGTGAAEKEQVKFMVQQLTGVRNIKTYDESDALAVCLCYAYIKKTDDIFHSGKAC